MIYHVRAGAPAGGDGSAARPFSSISAAAETAKPGDEVVVAPGVYREWVKPETAGRFISRVALKNSKKPVYTIGFGYRAACAAVRILPARVTNFIVGKLYC